MRRSGDARYSPTMSRLTVAATAAVVLCLGSLTVPAHAQTSTPSRAIVLHFTPTVRSQIAIWIEKPDGTFLSTVGLTQAVSVRGIGNRPGATQMNSGYHWPYGRREGVLPIWAHRRAAAPDVPGQFPRVIFQNREEGWASRLCEDSTLDTYFCLPFSGNTHKDGLDAVSCASPFMSDKGRILTKDDVASGYSEPVVMGGQAMRRPLSLTSLYPPRREAAAPCAPHVNMPVCQPGLVARSCNDTPDVAGYTDADGKYHPGFAEAARAAMPDIDAVTMATPPGDVEQSVMYSVPEGWPQGEYVAWLEINTEGDYNAVFSDVTFPTPRQGDWDSWATGTGYPYRGQPSVVYSVPFMLGEAASTTVVEPAGFSSVDGLDPDSGSMHAMDGSITDDPAAVPGSGADRLRHLPGTGYRLKVEVRDGAFCRDPSLPAAPAELTAEPVSDPKNAHHWGRLRYMTPPSGLAIAKYDVRYSKQPINEGDSVSFIQGLPALAATNKMEALMVPVAGPSGSVIDVEFGGLDPSTKYWIAVRAVDVCNRAGPHAVAEMKTTKVDYTQLSGCFVATAAWGSPLQSSVAAMRRLRDRLRADAPWFAVMSDLYQRSGPPAAALLGRSDAARVLARRMIGPLGLAAEAAQVKP
jgi:hypothetical protein